MKNLIIIAALAASSVVHAQRVVRTDDSLVSWTPIPSSVRVYRNTNNTLQYDMLWDYESKRPGRVQNSRDRIGVTGCDKGQGLIAWVDHKGTPDGKVREWVHGGGKVMDGIAESICEAAADIDLMPLERL